MSILKRFSTIATVALALTAVLFVSSSSTHAATPEVIKGKAVVINVTGSANVKIGDILPQGTTIITGPNSSVVLDLGVNGQALEVKPDSSVVLQTLTATATTADIKVTTLISVDKGGVNGSVKKLSKESKYEVKTTKGVAGIRGTTFSVNADGSASCWSGQLTFIFIVNGVPLAPITIKAGETLVPPTAANPVPTVVKTTTQAPVIVISDNKEKTTVLAITTTTAPVSPLTGASSGSAATVYIPIPEPQPQPQ